MDQSGLTGLAVPDLIPYWNLVAPRISARVATEVFFNLGPREVKFHLFVAIIEFPLGFGTKFSKSGGSFLPYLMVSI